MTATLGWLLLGLTFIVSGLLVLVFGRARKGKPMGAHSWVGEGDVEPDGDTELVAAVTGLGEQREPGEQARVEATELNDDWPDLRGERDIDPAVGNPWRQP